MSKRVFAELSPSGDAIEVHFRYDIDLLNLMRELPGARYINQQQGGPHWLVPLNLDSARRLNENMGPDLVLGLALRQWGKEATKREASLQTMAITDDLPLGKLKIAKELPELAEWLRGYQRADTQFLAATSALNLNQQRLGKTPETIAAIFEAGLEQGPHLVAAPRTSLNTVWRFEIERWTAKLEKPHEVITYSGEMTKTARQAAIDEFWQCIDDEWPVWFVCTYQTVRDGAEPFMDPTEFPDGWATFTIDEFHKSGLPRANGKGNDVKGNSKFSLACKQINAQRRYALSGTPMGGKPIKLWGALHFLYPQQFTSKWQWAKTWLEVSNNGFGTDIGSIQRGRADEFYRTHAPYMVRRLRSEVLPQLPPAQWIDVWCDMSPAQAKQYQEFAARAETTIEDLQLNALGILAEYTRLKVFADSYCATMQEREVRCDRCDGTGDINGMTCVRCIGTGKRKVQHPIPTAQEPGGNLSGKLPFLLERLAEQGIVGAKVRGEEADDAEGDSLAIVASQFKEIADMYHAYLNHIGIKAVKITGDTKDEERTVNQMLFRQDGTRRPDDPRVIVMTTTAGGVAITLDLVENVHIMDETWTPDDQEQLADRAVNTSRMHQVGVYVYRSRNTVEHHIAETNVDKAHINREILDLRRQGFRATMREEAKNGKS
jgi:SNF2 family DNA or RNA helicase